MKHILCIILTFLMLSAAGAAIAVAGSTSPWPEAIQVNADKLAADGVPEKQLIPLTQAMVQARFPEQAIISLQDAIKQAHASGISTTPVTDKIFEGIAKHASPPAILQAVERVTERYRQATQLAARLTEEKTFIHSWGTLIATGNAAGLPFQDLENILQQVKIRKPAPADENTAEMITQTLTVARDLARQTVPPDTVREIVSLAVSRGFSGRHMQELNTLFRDRSRQNSLSSATASCLENLRQQGSPETALHNFGTGRGQGAAPGRQSQGRSGSDSSDDSGGGNRGDNSGSGGESGNGGNGGEGGGNGNGGSGGGNGR